MLPAPFLSLRALLVITSLTLLSACGNQPVSPEEAKVQAKCTPIRTLIAKNYRLGFMARILGNGGGGGIEISGTALTNEQADRQLDIDRICRAWAAKAITDAEWAAFLRKQGTASLAELSKATSLKDRADYEAALKELATAIAKIDKHNDAEPGKEELASLVADLKGRVENLAKTDTMDVQSELLNSFKALDGKIVDGRSAIERSVGENSVRLDTLNDQLGGLKDSLRTIAIALNKKPEPPPSPPAKPSFVVAFVQFEKKGSHELTEDNLRDLREKLQKYTGTNVTFNVSGYADATGSVELNEKIAFRRGAVVRDWLIDEMGIPSSMITVIGRVRPYVGDAKFTGRRVAVVRISANE